MKHINSLYKLATKCLNYFGITTGFNSWTGYVYYANDKEIFFKISRPYNLDFEGRYYRNNLSAEQIEILNYYLVPKSCLGIMIKYNLFNNKMKIMNKEGKWI